jgi:peptidoglycan-associated lipoprotein
MLRLRASLVVMILVALVAAPACGGKKNPNTPGTAPGIFPGAVTPSTTSGRPPGPDSTTATPITVPGSNPVSADPLANTSNDAITKDVFKPVFFVYDSDTLDDAAKKALTENAALLRQNGKWVVTVEGHCDERGSAEYNLALGDRRALAARNFLQTLGVTGDRLRTVSYGKEFPFDPGHDEGAWSLNRRAQFVLTSR